MVRRPLSLSACALVVLVSVIAALPAIGASRPGRLDKTFSRDGIRRERFGPKFEEATDVLTRPDGSIITGGWLESAERGPYVAKYRPDGALKKTFGTNGLALFDIGDYTYNAELARQSDGKLLIMAHVGLSTDAFIGRFERDGDPDPTFSVDGYDVQDLTGTGSDYVEDLVILPDGDIFIVGWTTGPKTMLVRYDANGALDGGFGTGGVMYIDTAGSDLAMRSELQDEMILVGGRYEDYAAVFRVDRDGALDPTFGEGGVRRFVDTTPVSRVVDIQQVKSGKILALIEDISGEVLVARLTPNGNIDTSYGDDGFASLGNFVSMSHLAIQPRGRVAVVGSGATASQEVWRIARLTQRGRLDRRFSGDGKHSLDLPGTLARPHEVASQKDGKPVAVGTSGGGSDYHSTLVRYTGDVETKVAINSRAPFRVSGSRFPALRRGEVIVTLLKKSHGRFVVVARKRANLGAASDRNNDGFPERGFYVRFQNFGGGGDGRCKVVVRNRMGRGYGSDTTRKGPVTC
jgi:uncharacterized delta-60 repeat protein